MAEKCDILIAGGGLNGMTLAVALASGGFSVKLVEPQSADTRAQKDFDGRSYALAIASKRVLQALNVWPTLAETSQPILDIKVTAGRAGEGPGPFALHFDHAEIEEGPMGFMVEDRHLRPALLDALADSNVDHLTGLTVASHEASSAGVHATLSDGTEVEAQVLVGCDGKRSGVAARAGIRRTGWQYGQTSLVAAVSHELPHNGVAHQFFMPAGPLAILPLQGNRASIVWTEETRRAAEIQALDDAGYLSVLRPRFGDFLGDIALDGARFTFPLELSIANKFVGPRIALVGDAAHVVHPIAGQGLNAGLRDVAALSEVLTDSRRRGEDTGATDVLERYQSWRRFDTAALAVATDGFNRLFSNDVPMLSVLRNLGLGAVNAMPKMRRGFIREAAGLTGDLPRLARGQPL